MKVGIVNGGDTKEVLLLIEELKKTGIDFVTIRSSKISYNFDGDYIKVVHNDDDISDINVLIVRSTKSQRESCEILTKVMDHLGCFIIDGIERFSENSSSKLMSTLRRYHDGNGSNTIVGFSKESTKNFLKEYFDKGKKVIVKPISGSCGKGVELLSTIEEAKEYIRNFDFKEPILLQEYTEFKNEYRVMSVGPLLIGVVEKIKSEGKVTANYATGAKWIKVDDFELSKKLFEFCYGSYIFGNSIIGFDIGRTSDDRLIMIEENYSPQWIPFQETTGINVAEHIVNFIKGV